MGGVRSGADICRGGSLIGPGDRRTGGNAEASRFETVGGDINLGLSGWLTGGNGAGVVGSAPGEIEIIDGGVNEATDNQVNNQPLPERAFGVTGRIIHDLT